MFVPESFVPVMYILFHEELDVHENTAFRPLQDAFAKGGIPSFGKPTAIDRLFLRGVKNGIIDGIFPKAQSPKP